MSTDRRRHVLVVTTDSGGAKLLTERCAEAGIEAVVCLEVKALKAAFTDAPHYAAVVFDLRVSPENAKKIFDFVLASAPVRCTFFATPQSFAPEFSEKLESEGRVKMLDVALADADTALKRAVGMAGGPAKYDINLINCFITSVAEVLEYYTGERPEHDRPTVAAKKVIPPGFVSSVVKFDGKSVGGTTAFTCDKRLISMIASRINGSRKSEGVADKAVLIAAAEEMSDQIFGKAEILLGKVGYAVRMGTPAIHVGERIEIQIEGPAPFMVLPFQVKRKKMYVGFSLYRK